MPTAREQDDALARAQQHTPSSSGTANDLPLEKGVSYDKG
jgi:hypothetical protein